MNETKHIITNEGLRNKWFLPILILVFIVMGIFYNRSAQTTGELHLAEETKFGKVSSQMTTLPLEMYLTVTGYEDGILTVLISNQSGYEMQYTEAFELEAEINGVWERLTPKDADRNQTAVHTIADLEEVELTCDLTPYETLDEGHYRLILDDLMAEFDLEK